MSITDVGSFEASKKRTLKLHVICNFNQIKFWNLRDHSWIFSGINLLFKKCTSAYTICSFILPDSIYVTCLQIIKILSFHKTLKNCGICNNLNFPGNIHMFKRQILENQPKMAKKRRNRKRWSFLVKCHNSFQELNHEIFGDKFSFFCISVIAIDFPIMKNMLPNNFNHEF